MNEESERIVEQCRSNGLPCAAIFLDVDNFKRFNEAFVRQIADEVLSAVALAASTNVRFRGSVGWYGTGDKIVATLRNVTEDEAAFRSFGPLIHPFEGLTGCAGGDIVWTMENIHIIHNVPKLNT